MAKFDKIAVLKKIGDTGMVPVFYNKDLEICKNVVKACYEGGVRAFEFTNRGDFAQEVFGELVKWADKECPELARSLLPRLWHTIRNRQGSGVGLRPHKTLPWRCLHSEDGEGSYGTNEVVEDHGYWRCCS